MEPHGVCATAPATPYLNSLLNVCYLAQGGHPQPHRTCPLSGVQRTWAGALRMAAFDSKRRSGRFRSYGASDIRLVNTTDL